MPPFPVRQNDHAGTRLADHSSDLETILPGIFDAAVGKIECTAPRDAQDSCRILCLARAVVDGSASSHLSLSEIEDSSALAALRSFQQSAAAGLLDIITMGSDGENVESLREAGH
jgi:hypothetical protein